jgi:hypothetical protein
MFRPLKVQWIAAVSVCIRQKDLSVLISQGLYHNPHLQLTGNPCDLFISIVQFCNIMRYVLLFMVQTKVIYCRPFRYRQRFLAHIQCYNI